MPSRTSPRHSGITVFEDRLHAVGRQHNGTVLWATVPLRPVRSGCTRAAAAAPGGSYGERVRQQVEEREADLAHACRALGSGWSQSAVARCRRMEKAQRALSLDSHVCRDALRLLSSPQTASALCRLLDLRDVNLTHVILVVLHGAGLITPAPGSFRALVPRGLTFRLTAQGLRAVGLKDHAE